MYNEEFSITAQPLERIADQIDRALLMAISAMTQKQLSESTIKATINIEMDPEALAAMGEAMPVIKSKCTVTLPTKIEGDPETINDISVGIRGGQLSVWQQMHQVTMEEAGDGSEV